jgi:hypothetical protein
MAHGGRSFVRAGTFSSPQTHRGDALGRAPTRRLVASVEVHCSLSVHAAFHIAICSLSGCDPAGRADREALTGRYRSPEPTVVIAEPASRRRVVRHAVSPPVRAPAFASTGTAADPRSPRRHPHHVGIRELRSSAPKVCVPRARGGRSRAPTSPVGSRFVTRVTSAPGPADKSHIAIRKRLTQAGTARPSRTPARRRSVGSR